MCYFLFLSNITDRDLIQTLFLVYPWHPLAGKLSSNLMGFKERAAFVALK